MELALNRPQALIDEYAKVNVEAFNTSTVGSFSAFGSGTELD
jgi:hypothetical protein